MLRNLAHVVVSLLVTETRETEGGLTTTTVLFGEVNSELVDHFAGVSGESAEERTVSVHDDEPEARIGLEKFRQGLCVEFVIAQIQRAMNCDVSKKG